MIYKNNITGVILAGGRSTRMGFDKGLIKLNNETFISHIKKAMSPIVNSILLISNHTSHDVFKINRHEDLFPDAGPVGAIYTGLQKSNTAFSLVVSCDVPLITTSILKLLIDREDDSDVIQFQVDSRKMPLVALYRNSCAPIMYEQLKKGERKLQFVLNDLKVRTIELDKKYWKNLTNVNTKEELVKIRNHD
ncbi:molybdenum cofactor guanylyltransferase [Zhouia amylolytica]|uniref:Probable molybdenum cofactor guanylyltransferase n=1 Tax=Zhouia amylolytica AD3 TaxID=1286632 RepID=W2UP86_9FLAO|nr:molybdenum cofactor guanylyltransferase [Zhouia amylolytica]ETN95995.1 hypothetical protein P278_17170 [Zhouia amylolytica AD3]MCQ0111283.1 molybdenum cofactor guanylyltransferase [Zhouia amylolytica]